MPAYEPASNRAFDPPRLRTCERCGARQDRSLMCVVFLRPDGGTDIALAGSLYDARVEVWCDDCQAELSPFWAMLTGDPAEDCETIEDLYARRLTSKATIHAGWARLRDGTADDLLV